MYLKLNTPSFDKHSERVFTNLKNFIINPLFEGAVELTLVYKPDKSPRVVVADLNFLDKFCKEYNTIVRKHETIQHKETKRIKYPTITGILRNYPEFAGEKYDKPF